MRSKTKKDCKLCGEIIIDRKRNANCCKSCAEIKVFIHRRKENIKICLKRKFPNHKVKFRFIIDEVKEETKQYGSR